MRLAQYWGKTSFSEINVDFQSSAISYHSDLDRYSHCMMSIYYCFGAFFSCLIGLGLITPFPGHEGALKYIGLTSETSDYHVKLGKVAELMSTISITLHKRELSAVTGN